MTRYASSWRASRATSSASADEQLAVSLVEAQAQLGLGHAEQALELLLSTHLNVAGSRPSPVVRAGWNQATDGRGPGASGGGDNQAVQPTVFEKLQSGGATAAADPVVGEPVSDDYAASVEAISGAVQRENLDRQLEATVRRCLTQISQPQQTQQVAAQLAEWEKQHPDDPLLLEVKADLEIRQGRFDSAITLLDRLELLHPGDPNAACAKAKAWLGKQQPDKARAELDLALARDAGHAPSLLLYAQINLLDKRYAESLDQADRILRDNAGAVAAYLAKADALTGLGRPQEAVRALEDLIRINPKVAGAYLALGKAYEQAERADEAARVYASGRRSLAGQETLALAVAELRILARTGARRRPRRWPGKSPARRRTPGLVWQSAGLSWKPARWDLRGSGPSGPWSGRAIRRRPRRTSCWEKRPSGRQSNPPRRNGTSRPGTSSPPCSGWSPTTLPPPITSPGCWPSGSTRRTRRPA